MKINGRGHYLQADETAYSRQSEQLRLTGQVLYRTPEFSLNSEQADLDLRDNSGSFRSTRFFYPRMHGSGEASLFEISKQNLASLYDVAFTTCPRPPDGGEPDWSLHAPHLTLDREHNLGEATHLFIKIAGVPLLYLPYINFPLAGRKSGILPPSYSHSESDGYDFQLPFYWNIAPNQDATYTPRTIQTRGVMQQLEWRHLLPSHQTELNLAYLRHDQSEPDLSSRHFGRISHRFNHATGWFTTLDYNHVADREYLNQLGTPFHNSDDLRVNRFLEGGFRSSTLHWNLSLRRDQELSDSVTYRQLPATSFLWKPSSLRWIEAEIGGQWIRFQHPTETTADGDRTTLRPALQLSLQGAAGFITPRLAFNLSHYQLPEESALEGAAQITPIFSIDSQLVFERPLLFNQKSWRQTLEPRLYYLYIPFKDQSQRPNFDTTPLALSWNQLFSPDRFSGNDRLGDAHQITPALSSRLYDPLGKERVRLALGRIISLEQPKVDLNGAWQRLEYASYVAEATFLPSTSWSLHHSQQFAVDGDSRSTTTTLAYQQPQQGEMQLNYRHQPPLELRQGDLLTNLRLSPRWQLISRWLYDLELDQTLDTLLGVEYRSCCWAARAIVRDEWKSSSETTERSYYLTLELTGLARFGGSLEDELEHGILSATSP
ncbi:MAG: LPS-assembly protein LptD [Gammaproteobacteria bacterium]|nr:LPS-assembly protein LptD [Gammaproteobacteria bacterium]